jgi:hypothetical protein
MESDRASAVLRSIIAPAELASRPLERCDLARVVLRSIIAAAELASRPLECCDLARAVPRMPACLCAVLLLPEKRKIRVRTSACVGGR